MRVLGLDPSSSKSGYALVIDGIPTFASVWKPTKQAKTQQDKMIEWGDACIALLRYSKPDIVVVEECAPHRNAQTFRALMRFEAIAEYEAKRAGPILLIHRVSEARAIVLKDGKIKKEDAFYKVKALYPNFDWLAIDKGGDDMSDAIIMALAAPTLAERR